MTTGNIIIGIDPGSRITGYGVIRQQANKLHYVGSGCVRLTAKSMGDRLAALYEGLLSIIETYQPDVCSIEHVFMHQNANSALKLGHARGVAMVAMARHGIGIHEYAPRQIKQAVVGYGAADKFQVQHMVKAILGLTGSLKVDAADALAIAVCHAHSAKSLSVLQSVT